MAKIRTAASVICEFYDANRDMEPHEAALLCDYHAITKSRARTLGEAVRLWGDGTPAYQATRFLANRQEEQDLAAALERYDLAVQALEDFEGEVEIVRHLMAAE